MAYFARLMEHGSFTAAAKSLGIPKSTLSRRITGLEKRLGARLLYRSTRRLWLTELGTEYLRHCIAVTAAGDAAHDAVRLVQDEPKGRVHMTVPLALAQTLLVPAIPEFMERYPKVIVDLEATNRRVDLVADGVDIAIRVRYTIEDSSLVMRQIALSSVVMVASPALLERLGEPAHPSALTDFPSLALRVSDGRYQWSFTDEQGKTLAVSHTPRLVTDDMRMLRQAAAAGIGVVALPRFFCRGPIDRGELSVLLPDWQPPVGKIHAVYPYRRGLLPAVRSLVDFLGKRLPEIAKEIGVRPHASE